VSQKPLLNGHTLSLVWRNIGIQKITTTNWANKKEKQQIHFLHPPTSLRPSHRLFPNTSCYPFLLLLLFCTPLGATAFLPPPPSLPRIPGFYPLEPTHSTLPHQRQIPLLTSARPELVPPSQPHNLFADPLPLYPSLPASALSLNSPDEETHVLRQPLWAPEALAFRFCQCA